MKSTKDELCILTHLKKINFGCTEAYYSNNNTNDSLKEL